MLFATLSFATLAGSPIGGALVRQATLDSFHHLIILSVRFHSFESLLSLLLLTN